MSGVCLLVVLGLAPSASAQRIGSPGSEAVPAAGSIALAASPEAAEPLSAADKDLLVKVRLAGLWEGPAGEMAAQKGSSQVVREVGGMLRSQHQELDTLVVKAARQVGVELPNEPNADQQKWLQEMRTATGAQFDQVFVDRLRVAHGKVFPTIANVRAGTRNSVVRKLAQSANGFVLTHLTLLESTDLVNYSTLPLPPQPAGAAAGASAGAGTNATAGTASADLGTAASSSSAFRSLMPMVLLLAIPVLILIGGVWRRFSSARESYDAEDRYDQDRYDQDRYSQDRYDQDRYSQDRYDQDRYDQDRYSQDRYSQDRYDQEQYDPYARQPHRQTSFAGSADRSGRPVQTRSRLRP